MYLTEQEHIKREQEIFNQTKKIYDTMTLNEFLNLFRSLEDLHATVIMNQFNHYEFDYKRYCEEILQSKFNNIEVKPLSKEVSERWHQYQYQYNWVG